MKQILLKDFSGGLNNTADPTRVPTNMSPDLVNVEVLDSGAIVRRKGYSVLMDTGEPSPIDFITRLKTDTGDYIVTHQRNGEWLATLTEGGAPPVPLLSVNPEWETTLTAPYLTASTGVQVQSRGTVTPATLNVGTAPSVTLTTSGNGYTISNGEDEPMLVPLGTRSVTIDNPTGSVTVTPVPLPRRIVRLYRETTGSGTVSTSVRTPTVAGVTTAKEISLFPAFSTVFTTLDNGYVSAVGSVSILGLETKYYRPRSEVATIQLWDRETLVASFTDDFRNVQGSVRETKMRLSTTQDGKLVVTVVQYFGRAVNYTVTRDDVPEIEQQVTLYGYLRSDRSGSLRRMNTWLDRVTVDGVPTVYRSSDFIDTSGTGWILNENTAIEYIRDYDDVVLDMLQGHVTQDTGAVLAGTAGNAPVAVQAADVLFLSGNPDDGTYAYNGTAAVEQTSMPSGALAMVTKAERLFIGGTADDTGIIEYSAVGDFTDFTTESGGGALRPTAQGTGNPTVAMVVWNDYIVWASPRSLSSIKTSGEPEQWEVKELTQRFGCTAPRSMVATPNGVVFLTSSGVMAWGSIPTFGGDGEGFARLSDNIRGTIGRITHPEVAVATYHDGRYYLSICTDGSGANNETLVLKFAETTNDTASWTRYSYGVSFLTDIDGVLYGGGTDGRVYELEAGDSDDGDRIAMRYVTPVLGLSPTWKDYREVYIGTDGSAGQTLRVQTATDQTPDTPVLSFTSVGDTAIRRYPHRKKGNAVSLIFTGESSTTPITLTQVSVTYNERKR